jgi:peptidyl-prolyl cis-trans isomerase SurA
MKGTSRYNRSPMPSGNLYTFADQHLSNRDFASFIEKRGSRIVTKNPEDFIRQSIDSRVSDHIIDYENSVLERKYPDFRYLMTEFHDGILLFEISGKKIWNRVQEDSTGLHDYYENHKHEFLTPASVDATIYTLRSSRTGEKKLLKAYRKYSRKPGSDLLMLKHFNKGSDSLLMINEGIFTKGVNKFVDNVKWTKGIHSVTNNGYSSVVVITAVREPQPKPFDEVQGEMLTGYQEFLENSWVEQLKKKYTVKIHDPVLEEVRKYVVNE